MDFNRPMKRAASCAALFLFFLLPVSPVEAQTLGGSCPTLGWTSWAAINPGYLLYCNGTTWGLAESVTSSGLVGIGTAGPLSALDVNGGVAIGSYAGVHAAPSNSLIVSGTVAIGSSSQTAGTALDLGSNTNSMLLPIGTTGQRPSATAGMIRYNSTIPGIEAYYNTQWNTLASASNTITLGASATVTNPQRSGDATTGFYTPGASQVAVSAGGIEVEQWNTLASGVDYLSITPGLSGTAPKIAAAGTTATQHINLAPKGAAGVVQFAGSTVLWQDTTNFNTAVGDTALPTTVSQSGCGNNGKGDVAVGYQALNANTTGYFNTAVGYNALAANTTAVDNTAVGWDALSANTTGVSNAAVGMQSLTENTIGSYNTAVGTAALYNNTTGSYNTAVGQQALNADTTGQQNTAIGYDALDLDTTGTHNTVIGSAVASMILTTGSSNILIGTSSAVTTTAAGTSNNLNIGNLLQGDMTSSTALGTEALFLQSTASSVNYLEITGAATTTAPVLSAAGTDTNISMELLPKGTGGVGVGTTSPSTLLEVNGQAKIDTTLTLGLTAGAAAPTSNIAAAVVATGQTTSSTSFAALTTAGPAVTMTTSTTAIVTVTSQMSNSTAADGCEMGFAVSGATTAAASATQSVVMTTNTSAGQYSATFYVTGLTAGGNTFTAKYAAITGGTCTFTNRNIVVMLP